MNRRVALIANADTHVGPDLARILARRGHDLVLGDPVDGLADELRTLGVRAKTVAGTDDIAHPAAMKRLVTATMSEFGRLDAVCIRTGQIVTGAFLDAGQDDLALVVRENVEAVFHCLQIVLPRLIEQGGGQVLVITSASGAKPTPIAPLYSATRAAANMLVKNVALEVADKGVTVNAAGTNFLDYPGFIEASGASDAAVRKRIENAVPVKRLGRPEEAAHFCASLLDGQNMFQTGQFFSLSGGWSD